jgi:hypothetical protein
VAFARVVDGEAGAAEGGEEELDGGDYGEGWGDGVALCGKVAAGAADWRLVSWLEGDWVELGRGGGSVQSRCMSIIMRAVVEGESEAS